MENLKGRIIIGHYYGKSFWSWFIRLRSWWESVTHTAAFTPDMSEVYEAWKKGCVKDAWENSHHKKGTPVDVTIIRCTLDQQAAFYGFLEKTKGAKYDWKGVVFNFLAQGEKQDKDKYFCTEWIELALEAAGLRFQDRMPAHKMSPSLAHISPIQEPLTTLKTP
jgi:hypothetical protein